MRGLQGGNCGERFTARKPWVRGLRKLWVRGLQEEIVGEVYRRKLWVRGLQEEIVGCKRRVDIVGERCTASERFTGGNCG